MKTLKRSLANFLNYNLWAEAKKLLDYQIEAKKKNAHFKNLSMYAYEKITDTEKDKIESEQYFEKYIATGLCYLFPQIFYAKTYGVPKSGLGIRKFQFISYPLRILHYAIGLYIYNLTDIFRENVLCVNDEISSFYGGSLRKDAGSFIRDYQTIYYKPHYREFQKKVYSQIGNAGENSFLIKLDIQNCFEDISITKMLNNLDGNLNPSTLKENNFDATTKSEIQYFYNFLLNGNEGIPQDYNDILSKLLSQIFLSFVDLTFEDDVNLVDVNSYKILRYVDDYYIFVKFTDETDIDKVYKALTTLTSKFAHNLYKAFDLRLNNKCTVFNLNKEEDVKDIKKRLKKVSPRNHASLDIEAKQPDEVLEQIFEAIENLIEQNIDPNLKNLNTLEIERHQDNLKGIYDENVRKYLSSDEGWQDKLKDVLSNFDFELVKLEPPALSLLIKQFDEIEEKYEEFLMNKSNLTYKDTSAILEYLSQDGFKNEGLVEKLFKTEDLGFLERAFKQNGSKLDLIDRGLYCDLNSEQLELIKDNERVLKQGKLRVLREKKEEYSVALNHLLNELHVIIWETDDDTKKTAIKKYNAQDVKNFLSKHKAVTTNKILVKVRRLFNRRNINTISHSTPISFSVSKEEYSEYKGYVKECIEKVIPGGD